MVPLISKNRYGFRLSLVDIAMLTLTIIVTYLFPRDGSAINLFFNLLIPYVVLIFFLFCNVFRVRTKYELCWLVSATINLIAYLFYYQNMPVFFASQSLFTLVAIMAQVKSNDYRGIFSHKGIL